MPACGRRFCGCSAMSPSSCSIRSSSISSSSSSSKLSSISPCTRFATASRSFLSSAPIGPRLCGTRTKRIRSQCRHKPRATLPAVATTLVLLPGLDGTEILLQPLVAALPKSVQPLVVPYPPSGDNTYAGLLALVRRALAGVAECHVLGWSFAGPLALMLAAAEPARVRSVILSASFVQPPTPLLGMLGFALAAPPVRLWRAARRAPLWLLRPRSDPLRRAKARTWQRVAARDVAARLRAIAGVDVRALLQACEQPLLYLASTNDGIVPRHNADEILRLRPSARLVAIDGPHLALFTNPRAAATAIVEFIGHQTVTADREYRAASS